MQRSNRNLPVKYEPTARTLLLLLAAVLYFGCTTGYVPATGDRRYLGYTWQQETEIGKQASKEVAATFGLYHDDKLEQYVSEVGNRLLTPWRFPVVMSTSRGEC